MADFALVQAALRATTGTQDFTVSGFGTPKGAVVYITTGVTNGTVAAHAILGIGTTDGTRNVTLTRQGKDAVSTTVEGAQGSTNRVVTVLDQDGGDLILGAFSAWITDGLRLNFTTVPGTQYLVTVLLMGGNGVSNVYTNLVTSPSVKDTGTTVSTVGFQADVMLTFGLGPNLWNDGNGVDSYIGVGAVVRAASNPHPQFATSMFSDGGVTTTALTAIKSTNRAFANAGSGPPPYAIEVQDFTSSGFSAFLRDLDGNAFKMGYVCIKLSGISAKVLGLNTPTSGGSQSFTGAGFTPQFGMLFQNALTADDTRATDGTTEVFGIGMMTSAAQYAVSINETDNVSTSVCKSVTHSQPVFLRKAGATFMDATFTAFTSDGVTLNWGTFDGTARKWAGLFIQSGAILINVSDSTTVTESVTLHFQPLLVSVNDSVTVTEADFLVSSVILPISANDATTVTDVPTVLLAQLTPIVSDSTAVTESISITYAQVTLAVNVNDPVVMLDLVGGILTFQYLNVNVFDTVGANKGFETLAWNANTEPDLAGYKVYQGTTSGAYDTVYDVGLTATPATPLYVVLNLNFGTTYFFVVTAYDNAVPPNESGPSSEVSATPADILLGNVVILMNSLNVSDATTVTDVSVMDLLITPIVFDGNVIVTEGQALQFPFEAAAPSDSTAVTESISLTFVTQAQLTISVGDATTVTDAAFMNLTGIYSVNDATTVTDVPKMNLLIMIPAMAAGQDTTAVTDPTAGVIVQIIFTSGLSVFDSTAVTDAVTVRMAQIVLNVFDSVLVSDGFLQSPRLVGTGGNTIQGRLTNIAGTSPDTVLT